MNRVEGTPTERLRRFLEGNAVARIDPLVGDASNRAYLRITFEDGSRQIAALLPEPFDPDELPFLNVRELLAAMPIKVPRVMAVSGEEAILLLEDLGDTLLQDAVENATSGRKRELYHEAIDILARLQQRGDELAGDRYLPYRKRFDVDKFVWELEFFREHFLEGLRGRVLSAEEREEIARVFGAIARELCAHHFVLCHRDYHSRNLMVTGDGLAVIDFQDARRGPRVYDLVSLLNDSYVLHSQELVSEMIARFESAIGAPVSTDYDVAALQRNLKALGTFGFQIAERDNTVYERYVGGTLGLVRTNLERNPRWEALRRILARHCEEIS